MGRLETRQETTQRHSQMWCRVFTFKLDTSKLSRRKRTILKDLFTQAKYLYNNLLEQVNNNKKYSDIDTKITSVPVLTPDGYEDRTIELLSSQIKQGVFDQLKTNRKAMIENVKQGNNKKSKLHYLQSYTSIPLKQTSVTYKLDIEKKRVYLQGLCWFRIDGVRQIADIIDDLELANARIVKKPSGYYFQVTTFAEPIAPSFRGISVGLDFGMEKNITTSDGEVIDAYFDEPEKLKEAQRANAVFIEWAKENDGIYRSSNKQKNIMSREYERLSNAKDDLASKVVHNLLNTYDLIFIQDESLKAWQQDKRYSKTVHHSIMGRVIRKLKNSSQTIVIDKWTKTTGICPECGHRLDEKLDTSVRSWVCPECGTGHDRDFASAQAMVFIGVDGLCELSRGRLPRNLSRKRLDRFEHALEVLRLGDTAVSGSLDCPQQHAPRVLLAASDSFASEAHAL